MLSVKLVAHTENAEKIVAAAAKMCYSNATTEEIISKLDDGQTEKFLDMLVEIGHESPVEHASFTFAVDGVSRTLLAQLTRHRIASYSVQSQRYVKENNFAYVTPPEIECDEEAKKIYIDTMKRDSESYLKLSEILEEKHYARLISEGMGEKKARSSAQKNAIEDARYVLPNSCETKLMMTLNTRSLYNFFKLRTCNRAQWEIRDLAREMLFLCREAAPTLFARSGPSCLYATCSEGKMCCGKQAEVKEQLQVKNR